MKEKDAPVDSIIETKNGNRYLILENRCQIYLYNKNFYRSDDRAQLKERSNNEIPVVGHLVLS